MEVNNTSIIPEAKSNTDWDKDHWDITTNSNVLYFIKLFNSVILWTNQLLVSQKLFENAALILVFFPSITTQ